MDLFEALSSTFDDVYVITEDGVGKLSKPDEEQVEEEDECEEEEDEGMAGDEVDARTDRFAHQDPERDMDRREDW